MTFKYVESHDFLHLKSYDFSFTKYYVRTYELYLHILRPINFTYVKSCSSTSVLSCIYNLSKKHKYSMIIIYIIIITMRFYTGK